MNADRGFGMGEMAGNELFTRRKPGNRLFAFYEQITADNRNPAEVLLFCKPFRKVGLPKDLVSELKDFKKKPYRLQDNATRLAKALATAEDTGSLSEMAQRGYLESVTSLQALRSFAWTAGDYKKRVGTEIDNLSEKELAAVARFVTEAGFLNYRGGSFFPGLCSTGDKDVIFVPEGIVRKGAEKYRAFGQTASLNRLQKDLIRLKPVMESIAVALFAGAVGERDRNIFTSVLSAWCALSIAAQEPFLLMEGPKRYKPLAATRKDPERALPGQRPKRREGDKKSDKSKIIISKEAIFEQTDIEIISKRLLELQEDEMVANNDPGRERTVEELIAELMGSATQQKAPEPAPAPAPVEPEWEVSANAEVAPKAEPESDIEPEWEVSFVKPQASTPVKPVAPVPAPVAPAPVIPEPAATVPEPVIPEPAPVIPEPVVIPEPEPVAPAPVIPDPNYVPPEPSYFFNQSFVEPAATTPEPAAVPEPEPVAPAPVIPDPNYVPPEPTYFFNQSILESVQPPAPEVIAPEPVIPEPVVIPEPEPVIPEPVVIPEPAPAAPEPVAAPEPAKPVSTIPDITPEGVKPSATPIETNQASQEEIDEHEAAVRRRMREILEQNKRKQQEKDEVRRQMEERRLEVARRQEQRRQEILAKRKADYERLLNEQEELRKVVEENKNALMGERKRKRIEAQRRIDDIEDTILKEYLDLKRGTNDYHTGLTQEL